MSDHDFPCVFYSNVTFIMNRFRDNDVFFANRKWRHGDISAMKRRTENSMTVPEWVTMTSYLCCKLTSRLSCSDSEIMIFSCELERSQLIYPLYAAFYDEFWKIVYMVSSLCSIENVRLSWTVCDIMRFSCEPKMTSSFLSASSQWWNVKGQ